MDYKLSLEIGMGLQVVYCNMQAVSSVGERRLLNVTPTAVAWLISQSVEGLKRL